MGIEKTELLACESIYCPGMSNGIENNIKNGSTCLDFQQMRPKEKIIHSEILDKQWEVFGMDMFTLHNKIHLCIVDYHRKFPVIKKKTYWQTT